MAKQEPGASEPSRETLDVSHDASNTEKAESKQADEEETEATFPAKPAETDAGGSPADTARLRHRRVKLGILGITVVVLFGLVSYGSYAYGDSRGRSQQALVDNASAAATSLQVPKGATIIEQCDPHKGTQYILPSKIPNGPVYNVYKGKVIGVEYMIGKQDLASNKSFLDLPLFGQKYVHMNIGLLSQGHAGYPVPHYHVDLYSVPFSEEQAISCTAATTGVW